MKEEHRIQEVEEEIKERDKLKQEEQETERLEDYLSNHVTSGCDIMPCNRIDKPLQFKDFSNVTQ